MNATENLAHPQSLADPVPKARRHEYLLAALLLTAASLALTHPILSNTDYWGPQDWDQHLVYNAVPVHTLLQFQQIPLWNPYVCGGMPMMAYPQSRCLSPTVVLLLLFGTVLGIKLEIVLYFIVGSLGVYSLSRHFRLQPLPALFSALIYMLCSMHALQLATGMTWALSIQYLPWVLLTCQKCFDRAKFLPLTGLLFALIFFAGGHYIAPITGLAVLFLSLLAVRTRGVLPTARNLFLIAVWALGIGAIKLIPAVELVHRFPRPTNEGSGFGLEVFPNMLLGRDQTLPVQHNYSGEEEFIHGMVLGMDENGMYIGWVPLAFFILGLVWYGRRHWNWVVCIAVFVWLSFGTRIPISIWEALRTLPVFSSMYATQRFRIVFLLFVALFAGLGLQGLRERASRAKTLRPFVRFLAVGIVLGVVTDLLLVSLPILRNIFVIPPAVVMEHLIPVDESFRQISRWPSYDSAGPVNREHIYATASGTYPAFLLNKGTVNAYEYLPVSRNAIASDAHAYRGEVYLQNERGRAAYTRWSPNRLTVEVEVWQPDFLVVNQNYDPGWKVTGAASDAVESVGGLLGVRVIPTDKEVEIYYLPNSFLLGCTVTAATLGLWGLLWALPAMRSLLSSTRRR